MAAAIALPASSLHAQDDPDLQLLAYWNFEGENANGVSGDEETVAGELMDPAVFSDDGKFGAGANFDAGGSIHVADASFLNVAAERDKVTFIFWQKNVSDVRNQSAFWAVSPESGGGQRGAQVHTPWSNGEIYFDTAGCCDGGTQRVNQAFDGDWDVWNQFVFVKDGENKIIYANGDVFLEGTNTSPLPQDFSELWIGSAVDSANAVPGIIDEFAVMAGVLSPAEVKSLYEDEIPIDEFFVPIDEDGDGMSDTWEERYGLDPTRDDTAEDPDGDTLTNIQEYESKPRTIPNKADSDDDGLSDQHETNTGVWNGLTDTGTNPTNADSDRDKLSDGVENPDLPYVDENQPGTDPNIFDTDGDLAGDGLEAIGGVADPTDPKDVPSSQFKGGNWLVKHVWTDGDQIGDVETAEAALNGETALQAEITVEHPVVHFHDNAGPPWDFSFGGEVPEGASVPYPLWNNEDGGFGDRNDFAIRATGQIFITNTGLITFNCNSDDGFSLRIDGNEVGNAGNRGRGNTIMEVELEEGTHDVEFIHWERGGGAGVSLLIHRGIGTAPAPDNEAWELLQTFNAHEVVTEDTDGDGIDDFKETFFFGDLSRDGSGDFDEDGLIDSEEFEFKVDPDNKDHDGDGLEDGPEVATHGTDPGNADTDGDTLADGAEISEHQTDPTKADSDSDNFDDNVELALGTDPNDAGSFPQDITAVAKGEWSDPTIWSNGEAPSSGNTYAVIGSVVPTIDSDKEFLGDRLTVDGATLNVGHSGAARVAELLLRNGALLNVDRASTGLSGSARVEGEQTINTSSGTLDLRSQFAGDSPITVTGGGPEETIGGLTLNGIGNDYDQGWTLTGTVLTANTPGSAGSGGVFLNGGRLVANADIFAPDGFLDIAGDGFGLELNGTVHVADLRGIDPEGGGELFRLSQLAAGVFEFTAEDLRNAFGVDDSVVSGDGLLRIVGDGPHPDADGDGMADEWEEGDLAPDGDEDGDGLTNYWEFRTGADKNNPDTDGDGLNDGDEVAANANPLVADTDGDGDSDADEASCPGGDPNNDRLGCGVVAPTTILQAYWKFDDEGSPDAAASEVNGITAALLDGAVIADGGYSGRALDLGTTSENQRAVLQDASILNKAGERDQISISFFQKLVATPNASSFWMIGEGEGGDRAFQAHVPWSNGEIYLDSAGCCDGATQRINAPAPGDLVWEEWHHFAFVKDEEDKTIYIDGEVFLEGKNTGVLPFPFTQLDIGSATNGGNSIHGLLDEFAVYEGALTAEEVGLLASGVPATEVPATGPSGPDGLLVSWEFNSGNDGVNVPSDFGSITGVLHDSTVVVAEGGVSGGALDLREGTSMLVEDVDFYNEAAADDVMTLVFWQKLTEVTNQTTFKAQSPSSSGGERGWSVHTPWGGNDTIFFDTVGCCDTATQRMSKATPAGVDYLEWNHFAFVKDGDNKQIWVNGALHHEATNTSPLPEDFTALWIGAAIDGTESTVGWLDDVAIFNRVLDDAELGDLAGGVTPSQLGSGVVPPDPPDPETGPGDISDIMITPDGISFAFPEGSTYDVEYSVDLANWEVIASDVTGVWEDTDAGRVGTEGGYYRGLLKQ